MQPAWIAGRLKPEPGFSRFLYKNFFGTASMYMTTVFTTAWIAGLGFDAVTTSIWETNNKGVRFGTCFFHSRISPHRAIYALMQRCASSAHTSSRDFSADSLKRTAPCAHRAPAPSARKGCITYSPYRTSCGEPLPKTLVLIRPTKRPHNLWHITSISSRPAQARPALSVSLRALLRLCPQKLWKDCKDRILAAAEDA